MLSNFLYAARKRWKRLGALGKIKGWLDFHVFVGFMSPLVIAFHAAFQSNNLLASGTAGALAIVVTTGIIGRFIYGAVPSDGGKAVELADLLARFERLRDDLGRSSHAAGPQHARSWTASPRRWRPPRSRSSSCGCHSRRSSCGSASSRLRGRSRTVASRLEEEVVRLARLRWQIRFYGSLKRLLRGWRVFHASLAGFLVLAIAAHIGLSLYLGHGLLRR